MDACVTSAFTTCFEQLSVASLTVFLDACVTSAFTTWSEQWCDASLVVSLDPCVIAYSGLVFLDACVASAFTTCFEQLSVASLTLFLDACSTTGHYVPILLEMHQPSEIGQQLLKRSRGWPFALQLWCRLIKRLLHRPRLTPMQRTRRMHQLREQEQRVMSTAWQAWVRLAGRLLLNNLT